MCTPLPATATASTPRGHRTPNQAGGLSLLTLPATAYPVWLGTCLDLHDQDQEQTFGRARAHDARPPALRARVQGRLRRSEGVPCREGSRQNRCRVLRGHGKGLRECWRACRDVGGHGTGSDLRLCSRLCAARATGGRWRARGRFRVPCGGRSAGVRDPAGAPIPGPIRRAGPARSGVTLVADPGATVRHPVGVP
jgi:hypothetical protein